MLLLYFSGFHCAVTLTMEQDEYSLDNFDAWLEKNPIPPASAVVQTGSLSIVAKPLRLKEEPYALAAIDKIFFEGEQKVHNIVQKQVYGKVQQKKKHPCSHCGKGFVRKFDLQRHTRVHFKKYQCFECIESFMDKRYFKNHFAEIHKPKVKPYECTQCILTFMKAKELLYHLRYVHSTFAQKVFFNEEKVKQLEQYAQQAKELSVAMLAQRHL